MCGTVMGEILGTGMASNTHQGDPMDRRDQVALVALGAWVVMADGVAATAAMAVTGVML